MTQIRDDCMKPTATPAIDTKKWNTALETIFGDLVDRFEPWERRIILEGLAGIYVRLEETTEEEHRAQQSDATTSQICNVVHLETYKSPDQGGNSGPVTV